MGSNRKRPALCYFGGKWRIAPKIIRRFPPHKVYVEPFGGSASVLLRKEPARVEVYNDVDSRLVTTFKVLRDNAGDLLYRLFFTPWSREEYQNCLRYAGDDPVEIARSFIVTSFQGFPGQGVKLTMNRWRTSRTSRLPDSYWPQPGHWLWIIERLKRVILENQTFQRVITRYDSERTLFYVDPPYLGPGGQYLNSISYDEHAELASLLNDVKGLVVLSAKRSPEYELWYDGWVWEELDVMCIDHKKRSEVLIMNYEFI